MIGASLRNGRFRADRESLLTKISDGLYRGIVGGEVVFAQGLPDPASTAYNLTWALIYPDSGDVIDGYETLCDAKADAALIGMVA